MRVRTRAGMRSSSRRTWQIRTAWARARAVAVMGLEIMDDSST